MSTRVFKSTTPSSTFPISTGSADPSGFNSFTTASVSQPIYTGNCTDIVVKASAATDWTGSFQWEEADRDPNVAGVIWTLAPGTTAKASLTAAAGDDIQTLTRPVTWLRFNLVTQTGGGGLAPSVEGWRNGQPMI